MKNIIKNDDGTLDLLGLTKVEAFTLLMLTGNTSGALTSNVYYRLLEFFPRYDFVNLESQIKEMANRSTFCGEGDVNKIYKAAEKFFEKNENVKTSTKQLTVHINNLPKRDSKGRFKSKDWVAEFYYPAGGYGELALRKVVVSKDSPRSNPNSNEHLQIRGFDKTKGALRCFDSRKIYGTVVWFQE